jgi:hypothetical protein
MHPKVEQAIQEIDAAFFSGDEFENPDARAKIAKYVGRWARELAQPIPLVEDTKDYNGRGWEKPYPGATGTFTDAEGHKWEVLKIVRTHHIIYCRWDIDGEDPGASFVQDLDEGTYEPFPKSAP